MRLLAALAIAVVVAGCGSHPAGRRASTPTTTLIAEDTWHLPPVSGPPSQQGFCTLLVAAYTHVGKLPEAANLHVREQMVGDFVGSAPAIIASAPPPIASQAKVYLTAVSQILQAFEHAGLDSSKLPKGELAPLLLDPRIKAAGNQVLDYSETECHYTIGGA